MAAACGCAGHVHICVVRSWVRYDDAQTHQWLRCLTLKLQNSTTYYPTWYTDFTVAALPLRCPRNASPGYCSRLVRQGHLLAACRIHRRCSRSAAALCSLEFAVGLTSPLPPPPTPRRLAGIGGGGKGESVARHSPCRQTPIVSDAPRGSERSVAIRDNQRQSHLVLLGDLTWYNCSRTSPLVPSSS